jgi:hypothetical protein
MKIRTGFVSNSSSSSFAILGFEVTDETRAIAKKHANANDLTEDWWGCTKCDYVVGRSNSMYTKKAQFCGKCGTEMSVISKPKEISNWELFESLVPGMDYFDKTDYGSIAGCSVKDLSPEGIIELHKKLVAIFGDIHFSVMVGEYAC